MNSDPEIAHASAQVLEEICAQAQRMSGQRRELVRACFATGSYVAGHWNRQRPSLNVYFIAQNARGHELRLALAQLWAGLRRDLAQRGWELLIDCHPYTVSYRPVTGPSLRLVSLTTKVLEHEHADNRYRLPPTIGPGWCRSYRMLHGDEADLGGLGAHPQRDAQWARTVHRALSHYRNVLDHLPWALDWQQRPQLLVEESARYAEEAIKDAVSFPLTAQELAAGRHMELLSDWEVAAREFLAERFGRDAVTTAATVADLKAARERDVSIAEAQQCWLRAQGVWEWAWGRYLTVAAQLLAGEPDYARVDAFV
ncbi:hypothetical protein [Nocardia gipuzkoensis]|uniref:hypothetical protein n=1 Tax=Nocardia gipuzkoensis TaxID=2749991 RepID=UPI00237D4071|nr:hypothetical protein [Nocardia gipuzkoensis]MDE1674752.1 hypothetical protein [Nocardia gipuzkoensis]